jgi:regulator of sigma D
MAKGSGKKVENAQRLRYIRVLERFSSSLVNYLFKSEEVSKAVFDKKVDNNRKYLDRVEPVALYKGEYSDLEKLVQKIVGYRDSDEPIDTIKDDILYTANQIEKSMNRRRYKKDKHAADMFKDWE